MEIQSLHPFSHSLNISKKSSGAVLESFPILIVGVIPISLADQPLFNPTLSMYFLKKMMQDHVFQMSLKAKIYLTIL